MTLRHPVEVSSLWDRADLNFWAIWRELPKKQSTLWAILLGKLSRQFTFEQDSAASLSFAQICPKILKCWLCGPFYIQIEQWVDFWEILGSSGHFAQIFSNADSMGTATHCNTKIHNVGSMGTATHCNTLQHKHSRMPTLWALQHTATHCNTNFSNAGSMGTATQCNTVQHKISQMPALWGIHPRCEKPHCGRPRICRLP